MSDDELLKLKHTDKVEHLKFIEAVIDRMCRCSFFLKGWAVTLMTAVFAMAVNKCSIEQKEIIMISVVPVVIFWILDAYYLTQEKLYRDLYNEVSSKNEIDFNMQTEKISYSGFFSKLKSIGESGFYGALIIIIICKVMF